MARERVRPRKASLRRCISLPRGRNRDDEIERRPVPSLRATKNTRTNGLAAMPSTTTFYSPAFFTDVFAKGARAISRSAMWDAHGREGFRERGKGARGNMIGNDGKRTAKIRLGRNGGRGTRWGLEID